MLGQTSGAALGPTGEIMTPWAAVRVGDRIAVKTAKERFGFNVPGFWDGMSGVVKTLACDGVFVRFDGSPSVFGPFLHSELERVGE